MMIHTSNLEGLKFSCPPGTNGFIFKKYVFKGRAAHAGGSPHKGINALYAAANAMGAANALRETFQEKDRLRFHPIITKGGSVVNAIPDQVELISFLRGADIKAIMEANEKINRAFAGAAAGMGCSLHIRDSHGNAPRHNDPNLQDAFYEIGKDFFPKEEINFAAEWGTGCSDMGDISMVMPAVHPYIAGASGIAHGSDFRIEDPELACVTSAKIQAGTAALLLFNGAERAKKVIAEKKVAYPSIKNYLEEINKINSSCDAVSYNEDGTVTLRFKG